MPKYFIICLLWGILLFSCRRNSENNPPEEDPKMTATILTENLTFPWEIVWGNDNQIWMTERDGRISMINPQDGTVTPLLTISEVESRGEGGLLGMAMHPDFPLTPHIFVAYCYNKSGSYTEKIIRLTYSGTMLTEPSIIIDDIKAANIHNGCRLLIVGDKLFITTGDASDLASPQQLNEVNGKILRLNLDGSIPADNPDPASPVWTYGHRNAQGLIMVGNTMVSSEHGPDTDDEINIITRGGNYGWPDVRGECNTAEEQTFCNVNDVIAPIIAWTPTIAVSGIAYYNHDLLPQLKNSLLVATLKNSRLLQLKLSTSGNLSVTETVEYLVNEYGRLRDVCISPDGKIYVCTSNGSNDKIIEISKQ